VVIDDWHLVILLSVLLAHTFHPLLTSVMTSDGKTSEIKGDTLKYWRSSGGQLGVILAVEMQLVREADKGGTLAMKNDIQDFSSLFADVNSPTVGEVYDLVSAVTQKGENIVCLTLIFAFVIDNTINTYLNQQQSILRLQLMTTTSSSSTTTRISWLHFIQILVALLSMKH
jgi:hypothetical protein